MQLVVKLSVIHTRKNILFSGASGLFLMFGAITAVADPLPAPPDRPQLDRNGVDAQSGALTYSKRDVSIGGNNIGSLNYTRYFNSSSGWRDTYSNSLNVNENSDTGFTSASASIGNISDIFDGLGPSKSRNGSWINYSFYYNDGNEYQLKDGTLINFGHPYFQTTIENNTQMIRLVDFLKYKNGVKWTFHNKDVSLGGGVIRSRIQSITSNTGYQIKFFYETNVDPTTTGIGDSWGTISKVVALNNAYEYCDPEADTCSFGMTWPQSIYSFVSPYKFATDPMGNQTRYRDGLIGSGQSVFNVKTPESSSDNIQYLLTSTSESYCGARWLAGLDCYQPRMKVVSASLGGNTTTYSYSYDAATSKWTTTSTSPLLGQSKYVSSLFDGGITMLTDPLNRVEYFTYDGGGNLSSATGREGNYWGITRDTNGNITQTLAQPKPGSGLANLLEARSFGPCNQPTSITDPRGNVTTMTYDVTHCGLLVKASPTINGIQSVERYSYVSRYAWYKNSAGSYAQAATPVRLLSEMRTCRSTATVGNACAGGASDEITTSYDYGPNSGPNNLWLRGKVVSAGGTIARTCYRYDVFGNRISETKPAANLSACA